MGFCFGGGEGLRICGILWIWGAPCVNGSDVAMVIPPLTSLAVLGAVYRGVIHRVSKPDGNDGVNFCLSTLADTLLFNETTNTKLFAHIF